MLGITVTFCQGAVLSLGNILEYGVKMEHNQLLKKHFSVDMLCVHILQQVSISVRTKCNPGGERAWKLVNGRGNWRTDVERYSQQVVKALLFEYGPSCSENSGHVAKNGYREISFLNRSIKNWNQLRAQALGTFPCKPTISRKRGKQLQMR